MSTQPHPKKRPARPKKTAAAPAPETFAPTVAPDPPKPVMLLRTCRADMTSHNGFRWPTSGPVECPDWDPTPECGHGLHGLLWGRGDYGLLSSDADAKWLVIAVDPTEIVDLGGKVKVPRGTVIYCGTSAGALALLRGARWGLEAAATDGVVTSTTGADAHASTTGADSVACCLGIGGRVRAHAGPLVAAWRDPAGRRRIAVAYPGEDGIEPDVWYRLDAHGRFVRDEAPV